MGNVFDYLQWRGDLTIDKDGFNEVDDLVFDAFAFMRFDGIVPQAGGQGSITVGKALERFFAANPQEKIKLDTVISPQVIKLARQMVNCPRYREMILTDWLNILDVREQEQMCAFTLLPGDGTRRIIFRGTGGNLVGWRENFNMCLIYPVPAQRDAAAYLEFAASQGNEPLYVGGHSKGGNLAVYAAAHEKRAVQDRIMAVHNYDGPGFDGEMMTTPGYKRIKNKIRTVVPEKSIVGLLLEHEETYEVISSSESGLMQHNAFSWEVIGTGLVRAAALSSGSVAADKSMKAWIAQMSRDERKEFIDSLFSALEKTGIDSFEDLLDMKLKNVRTFIKALSSADRGARECIVKTMRALIREHQSAVAEGKKSKDTGMQD